MEQATGAVVARNLREKPGDKQAIAEALEEARQRTLLLMRGLRDNHLREPALDILSPPVWDLGHMANFEDLWLVQNLGGEETVPGCNDRYNALLNPRPERPKLDLLDRDGCVAYFEAVRRRALRRLVDVDTGPNADHLTRAGFVYWMLVLHEHQHQETLLQSIQLRAGKYQPHAQHTACPMSPPPRAWVPFEGGSFTMGRTQKPGVYDNEAPAHEVHVPAFELASHPVTVGEFLPFVHAGYPREYFSERGRQWLDETPHWAPLNWFIKNNTWYRRGVLGTEPVSQISDEVLCHVSFWEAEAFAHWKDARLPTEAEWERAAQGHPEVTPATAAIDHLHWGPGAASHQAVHGGLVGMLGGTWEWTSSKFEAYPGTKWFPYPDYSDCFYGGDFRVLRGGSWATRATIATPWFRNWDLPQRKQIFAGIRLARDAA